MENEKMLSLYDYLGKPAGSALGKAVWNAAKAARIKPLEREVVTKTYSGRILMYPESFLKKYFSPSNNTPF